MLIDITELMLDEKREREFFDWLKATKTNWSQPNANIRVIKLRSKADFPRVVERYPTITQVEVEETTED